MTTPQRVAFIKAGWHSEIVTHAYSGFTSRLAQLDPGLAVDLFDVPGAFETPLLAKRLAQSGRYKAIVAAAFVVDGGIYRHEFVAQSVVQSLMAVGLETGIPCLSVSLTPHHYQETPDHRAFFRSHFVEKGTEAANACHHLVQLYDGLDVTPATHGYLHEHVGEGRNGAAP